MSVDFSGLEKAIEAAGAEMDRLRETNAELLDALRAFCGDYESLRFKIPELHAAYEHAIGVIANMSAKGGA